ncbi:hypothetical protein K1T71_003625 [Dendrolimus kikuchii]|uniref:Uncharacterized protein n=1 Tax=Dendrolimus kikuchii TaxID=765133 RepID=A0ACC1D8J1_9NEOP|nr:hypothetical protein K1T71_003625 [Dendrolimus kikuchii]
MKLVIASICLFFVICAAYEDSDIVSARIETCRGCSLNRLPQVKSFVMDDAPKYDRVEVKFISGAPPELILLGEGDQELDRLPLANLSRDQCNELIESKGFTKQSQKSDL